MASNTVLKTPRGSDDFPLTDPLAELSRIMGLAREEAANSSEVDFDIDLEQELMGELLRDGASPTSGPVARVADNVDDPSIDAEMDAAFEGFGAGEGFFEPAAEADARGPSDDRMVDLAAREAKLEQDLVGLDAAFEAFDADFDAAIGEVEQPASQAVGDDPAAATVEAGAEAEADDLVAFDDETMLFEDEANTAEADLPPAVEAAPVAAAVAPAAALLSLEDELRMLLGRVSPAAPRAPVPANDGAISDIAPRAVEPADPGLAAGETEMRDQPAHAFPGADGDETLSGSEQPQDLVEAEVPGAAQVEMPAFDDFAFDETEFDDVDLATALAETLAEDEHLAAAAEAEYAKHVAKEASAALYSEQADDTPVDDSYDMAIDLEAELATFSDDEIVPMKPETSGGSTQPAASALRPLSFSAEPPASADAPAPSFDWRKRYAEMKSGAHGRTEAARQPEPVAKAAEPDPFAALAALAAQVPPPRGLSRANPVARDDVPADRAPSRPVASPPLESPAAAPMRDAAASTPSWRSQPAMQAAPRPVVTSDPTPTVPPREGSLRSTLPAAAQFAPPSVASAARTMSTPPLTEPRAASPVAPAAPIEAARAPFASAPASPAAPAFDDDLPDLSSLLDDANLAPDIETIDIGDHAVTLADDLDIPEIVREEPVRGPRAFDDLDADFADAFQQLSLSSVPRAPQATHRAAAPPVSAAPYYVERMPEPALPSYATAHGDSEPSDYAFDDRLNGFDAAQASAGYADGIDFAEDQLGLASEPYVTDGRTSTSRRGRGALLAAGLAAVALLAGVGGYVLWSGAGGDGVPVLVKADPSPVKVKPETPGGVVVPNQDGKVYNQVRGEPAAAPSQNKLVSGAEEPIVAPVARPAAPAAPAAAAPAVPATQPPVAAEKAPAAAVAAVTPPAVTAPADAAPLPQAKSEERVTAADTVQEPAPAAEVAAIAPRKVRTMIVRADGTLVPREDPPAVDAAAAVPSARTMPVGADPATLAAAQPAAQIPSAVPGAQDDVSILPAEDATPQVAVPAGPDVIVPMPRPTRTAAAEPVREVAAAPRPVRQEPAASAAPVAREPATPAVATVPAGGSVWTVQIASQPTREGAQSSYEDLAGRYGSVLGGKGVNIVQAEVSGKGTMWRVRVPAASKNDANILCAKLKTAGGSCFVTQ
jgi:hypothetical protein